MNKFDSTLLPQTNNTEEIQKGNLDLLAKINATILFMQEGIVTFAQEILKVLSTYVFPASRVSFAPGNSGLSATEVQTMGTELANPVNTKASVVDSDTVTGNDSADGGKVKKWTWTTVKVWVQGIFGEFGIGTSAPTTIGGTDMDIYKKGGLYANTSGLGSNLPFGAGNGFTLFVMPWNANSTFQIATIMDTNNQRVKIRANYNGAAFGAWVTIWTSTSDGNGGQPPAPKQNLTGNTIIGYEHLFDMAPGNTTVLGSGTYLIQALTYGASFGSSSPSATGLVEQIANGGATITGSGTTGRLRMVRIA